MYKIYYLPEGTVLDETEMAIASDNSCSQIVIGKSDIIKGLVTDFSKKEVISIPQYNELRLNNYSFKEKEEVTFTYINEWTKIEPIETISFIVYMVDFYNPKKLIKIEEYEFDYDGEFKFTKTFSIDNFGEYVIHLIVDGNLIGETDFIVYKSEDEEDGPRFEL